MNKTQLITKLVRGTIHRAITESVPAVFLIFWVGNYLHKAPIASSRYYGCLLILASLGFIIGVVWSYALGYRFLHLHPESDSLHGASPSAACSSSLVSHPFAHRLFTLLLTDAAWRNR